MKSTTSRILLRPFGWPIALLSLVIVAGCGGGGGGGAAPASPPPPPPPPPPTAIKIDQNDLRYRIPDPADTLIYNVTVVAREHQGTTVTSENTVSTTMEIQYYNPPSNISSFLREYVDWLEGYGYKALKTIITLGSGEQISSATLSFNTDQVLIAYDDDRIHHELRDPDGDGVRRYVLPFLPPLEAGQSSSFEYREFPDGYLWDSDHYKGIREFNVGNYSEIDVPLDEIEAYEISYSDENWLSWTGHYFGPDFITDYSYVEGKMWVHPKIGMVKFNYIVDEDEGYYEDGWTEPYDGYWTSVEVVGELSSVNFTTPTPQ